VAGSADAADAAAATLGAFDDEDSLRAAAVTRVASDSRAATATPPATATPSTPSPAPSTTMAFSAGSGEAPCAAAPPVTGELRRFSALLRAQPVTVVAVQGSPEPVVGLLIAPSCAFQPLRGSTPRGSW
jgi:hypothetical protein